MTLRPYGSGDGGPDASDTARGKRVLPSSRPSAMEFLRGGVWWIAGGAALGAIALLAIGIVTGWVRGVGSDVPVPEVTIIAFPTPAPPTTTPQPPTETPTPTQPAAIPRATGGVMRVGDYVEVVGTGGEGLRLRNAPAINADVNLLAYDNEVFQIRQGPQDADGHTWYELLSPSDSTRTGWAVADFLQEAASP